MTPTDDELLHDALREDAGEAVPPPGGFAEVQEVATAHAGRRRRMAMLVAAAAVALVAIVAGSVFAATRSDDEGGRIATVPDVTSSVPETTPPTVADTTVPEPTTTIAPSTTAAPVTPPTGTLPPETSFAAVTDWRPELDVDSIPYATAPAADPWQKLDMIATGLTAEPVEGRREVQGLVNSVEGDRAVIEIRVIGLADDSVGGVDYRMTLMRGADGQWNVTGGETRDYCIRGSDGTLCV